MKVVLDTNVLIAAFASRGLCEAILAVCLESHEIALSDHIIIELERHLATKAGLTSTLAAEIVQFLRAHASESEPARIPRGTCRDESDLAILGTAVAAGASVLVTGDNDLLSLGCYAGIDILSPRQFYERLG